MSHRIKAAIDNEVRKSSAVPTPFRNLKKNPILNKNASTFLKA